MERYICIHGHFYQPPRENPWLEAIEVQDSAYPYHDWNERITSECYAPNTISRILDEQGRIIQFANNYAKMSFNFGPTLLSWMEKNAPDTYEAILEADRESQKNFSGHGSALAQAYSHMILPLANRRDKYTQILWGIRDFEYRFGRKPEGMWLPETAVDLESLDILSELGITFTILAPHQAQRVRPSNEKEWNDVRGGSIDSTMAYTQHLPSGRSISLFFYNGQVSRAVAFEGLLKSGVAFAERLYSGFGEGRTRPQLVHIATDGESYGHHHCFGDMALAYALKHIEKEKHATLTNYGEYLEKYPPTHEVEIVENTSWSCAHGIERWRTHCGCTTGGQAEWNQNWRAPLREALNWVRDHLAQPFEGKGRLLLKDPWQARNDYVSVILSRSPKSIQDFVDQQAARLLNGDEVTSVLKLMELQRQAMLMYTSCGWFFDEISGIETVQIMHYAGRALQLAQELFGDSVEKHFLTLLGKAKSNRVEHGDGRRIYEKSVRPAMVNLNKVGAHYAVSSLFEEYGERTSVFCYDAERRDYQLLEAGKAKLAIGKAHFTSQISRESTLLTFGVLHFGDHNINCGVGAFRSESAYQSLSREVSEEFHKGDFPGIIGVFERHFGESTYSLGSLFRDQKRKILSLILQSALGDAEARYQRIYETNVPLMRFLKNSGVPSPKILYATSEQVLNASLRTVLENEDFSRQTITALLEESKLQGITLDVSTLEFSFRKNLEKMVEALITHPHNLQLLWRLEAAIELLPELPFQVNLWKVQNLYYEMLKHTYPAFRQRAATQEEESQEWVRRFQNVGAKLSVYVNLDEKESDVTQRPSARKGGRKMHARGSGILLHVTSLPSHFGIGDLGTPAYQFIDFLAGSNQSFWQILPLNPTDVAHGNCPYYSDSAFAVNPLLISPELLVEEGFLDQRDLAATPELPAGSVDYGAVGAYKGKLFSKAFRRFQRRPRGYDYERFCAENAYWLDDFALFKALKSHFQGAIWRNWPQPLRDRHPGALASARRELSDAVEHERFLQYTFLCQWLRLKAYCNDKSVSIIGDLPIYVTYDSADVWAHPEIFKLDHDKKPLAVAGVPPDYFSATGQLWGNPVYQWDVLKERKYDWWTQRIKHNLQLCDFIRIDHFRGFVAYWEVPAEAPNAIRGKWVEAPAMDFFDHLRKSIAPLPIIAEDLGVITPDVEAVMRHFDFPGMKLLVFAFGEDLPTNPYIPHNLEKNCVAYTGTHDNNTMRGWIEKEASPEEKERLFHYLGREIAIEDFHLEMVRLVMMSIANTAIFPLQDILGLGEKARMNRPAIKEGNWQWRLGNDQLTESVAGKLGEMTLIYGRAQEGLVKRAEATSSDAL